MSELGEGVQHQCRVDGPRRCPVEFVQCPGQGVAIVSIGRDLGIKEHLDVSFFAEIPVLVERITPAKNIDHERFDRCAAIGRNEKNPIAASDWSSPRSRFPARFDETIRPAPNAGTTFWSLRQAS